MHSQSKRLRLSKPASTRPTVEDLEQRLAPAGLFDTLANDLSQSLATELGNMLGKLSQEQAPLPILGKSLSSLAQVVNNVPGPIQNAVNNFESGVQNTISSLDPASSKDTVVQAMLNSGLFSSVVASVYDPAHGNVTFVVHFNKQVTLDSTSFHFNLGLPGVPFGLNASTQLDVNFDLDYGSVSLGMQNNNFFFTPDSNSQLTATVSADTPNLDVEGDLGFFKMIASPPAGVSAPIHLSVGLAIDVNGAAHLTGGAAIDVHLDATLASGPDGVTLPHIVTDFVMNWDLGGAFNVGSGGNLGSAPTVEFQNIEFGLGSFLSSMVQPVANLVDKLTAPLAPVYQLMQTPLPGLSDLADAAGLPPITLDTLAAAAVNLQILPPDYQLLAELGLRLHALVEIIRSTSFSKNDALIPMGSFNLSQSGDLRNSSLSDGQTYADWLSNPAELANLTTLIPVAVDATTSVEDRIKHDIGSLGLPSALQDQVQQVFDQIDQQLLLAENGVGLTFPLLDDPLSVFKLLLGQDVNFVKFDAKFSGQAQETKTIPVWGPVTAGFSGKINISMQLHAGVDTLGIREFFESILSHHADVTLLDKSFYVEASTSEPLVNLSGGITADAGPKLSFGAGGSDIFAEATFNGSVETDPNHPVTVNFVGANQTIQRFRPTDLGDPLFAVGGKISADLSFSVKAGVEFLGHVVGEKTVFSIPLAHKTLFDASAKISTANPLNNPTTIDDSIDVIFDARVFDNASGLNVLLVQAQDGNVTFNYNGIVEATYPLASIHSITVFGTNEDTFFSVSGAFGGRPIQLNGGDSKGNFFFFDDRFYNAPLPIFYSIHGSHMERDELFTLPGIGVPILLPTTVIRFQNMSFVDLNASLASQDIVSVYNLSTETTVIGGNVNNQYDLGGPNQSIDGLFSFLGLFGGPGFDQIIINDQGTTERSQYVVGHDQLVWSRSSTFTSPLLGGAFSIDIKFPHKLTYRNIDDIELNGGGAGNSYTVSDVPGTADVNPTAMNVVLDTGTGNDTVTAAATTGPLLIHGQGGTDVVTIGVTGRGTQDISGRVFVDNNGSTQSFAKRSATTLNINDLDDTNVRTVTFSTNVNNQGIIDGFTGTHTYPNPFAPLQSTTTIAYQISDLSAVNVQGSNDVNTFNVLDTPAAPLFAGLPLNRISTYLSLGNFINTVQVSGTTGPLTIHGAGVLSDVYLGGASSSVGELGNLKGWVVVSGSLDRLTIKDGATHGFRYYVLNADSFRGGTPAGITFPGLSLNDLEVSLSNDSNQVVINGTPTISADEPGVRMFTGNGSDFVDVNGTSAHLSLNLGAGFFQTVAIGSDKASLDNIEDVNVSGSGAIQSFVSDAAATTGQAFEVEAVPGEPQVERIRRTVQTGDSSTDLNTFTFSIASPNQVFLTAGRGGDQFFLFGTPANTTTFVTGGAGQDDLEIAHDDLTLPILGPVYFFGTASQGDITDFYSGDFNTPAQTYIFQATASKPFTQPNVLDQQLVSIPGDAPITLKGMATVTAMMPALGGNFVSIQGVPAGEALRVFDANNDRVIFGNAIASPIGYMGYINGTASIIATNDDAVSVTLDDSLDSTGRHVVLRAATDASGDSITGVSPGAINLSIGNVANVKLLGGLGNDTFTLNGQPLVPTYSIDGGLGSNTIDDSLVDNLIEVPGVYVNLLTGEATGYYGGISRIQNVIGSAFDDVLVGNGGNVLDGGPGNDLLIAGATASTLRGGAGNDILIGGTTAFDRNLGALDLVLADWINSGTFNRLAGQVTGNGGGNTLLGQAGIDLFYISKKDNTTKTDVQPGEVVVRV